MVSLKDLCGPADVMNSTLDHLHEACRIMAAFGPSTAKIVVTVLAAFTVGVVVLVSRLRRKDDAGTVVGNTFEGLLYGALAAWFGATMGSWIAMLLNPTFLAVMLCVFAVLALLILIGALVKGDGGAIKVAGVICLLALAGALIGTAAYGFAVPTSGPAGKEYESYVYATSFAFALTAIAGAIFVTVFRGYHWAVGWLLVPLNASWGAFGNLLGLMNHLASGLFYKNWGDVQETRAWYVRYDNGFHLKSGYDFTEGDAMSGNGVVAHEGVHVLQHFIAGPIYPLSHGAWVGMMCLPGLILGASKRTVAQGITDLTYFNNPWEVIAYAFGGTRHDSDVKQPLVFSDALAWIVAICWIAAATVGLIVFLSTRG